MAPEQDPQSMLALLGEAAEAASGALRGLRSSLQNATDMRAKGGRPGQYELDLTVDRAVLEVLHGRGVGVLSEESGLADGDADVVVVVDPVDGSTNASRGIPWYACSLCAVDDNGPWVALVVNLATGTTWSAVRGEGALRDGEPIQTSGTQMLAESMVVLNGHPSAHFGWRQYRALGATALDICAVADGSVDATVDCTRDALGPWDYMAAMLVLGEAGGLIVDVFGRELVVLEHDARRTPVAAGNEVLLGAVLDARGAS